MPDSLVRIIHKPRPAGEVFTDQTQWLVLEESPSFYIVFRTGDGIGIKLKHDYAVVEPS